MKEILEIKHLSKSFGKKKVIDDVSFSVNSGEVFGFLGPNGAGKTTTIKMIMGFLSYDVGEIIIDGINIKKDYEQAMGKLGGIVENPEMYKNLSGKINLEMYARAHDNIEKERIGEVVELVGMQNRVNEKIKKYSLGMKQRIGLAQALIHRPKVLILDEPTNGLDPAGIKELRDILKKLAHEENVAVIVSSHLLSEMELMCDRIGIIDKGKIIEVRQITDFIANSKQVSKFKFEINNVEKAKEIMNDNNITSIVESTATYIIFEAEQADVPKINKLLVLNDVDVFSITHKENSLEDAFIGVTGGGNTIA